MKWFDFRELRRIKGHRYVVVIVPVSLSQTARRFEAIPIELKFGRNGRTMIVSKPFAFIDGRGVRWSVPSGSETDGASIPSVFWSIAGGPFEGKYRDAAVVHDRYCDTRARKWQDTHEMFYDAMLASAVEAKQAWLMYQAVLRFGPRWPEPTVRTDCRLPDGRIDYNKCTENSGNDGSKKEFPSQEPGEIEAFLREMLPISNEADIENVRRELKRR